MATAKIFENGEQINHIVADEDFVARWCEKHGYTYEMDLEPPAPIEYTETQIIGQQLTDLELLVLDHIAKEDTV